jgi:hypothetical protein
MPLRPRDALFGFAGCDFLLRVSVASDCVGRLEDWGKTYMALFQADGQTTTLDHHCERGEMVVME